MKHLINLTSFAIFCLAQINAEPFTDGSEGWGGSEVKANYIAYGQEVIDYLKSTAEGQKIIDEHKIDISMLEKTISPKWVRVVDKRGLDQNSSLIDAITYSDRTELYEDRWLEIFLRPSTAHYLIFHEMLQTQSLDRDYEISGNLNPFPGVTRFDLSVVPKILEDHAASHSKQDAEEICAQAKEKYNTEYFFVSCDFPSLTVDKVKDEIRTERKREIVGYEVIFRDVVRGESREIFRCNDEDAPLEYSHSRGPWAHERLRHIHQEFERKYVVKVPYRRTFFGVKVYGTGDLKSLSWKTLKSSAEEGQKGIYRTEREAVKACLIFLSAAKLEASTPRHKFYRAQCFVDEMLDGTFRYLIKTKNPFIQNID